MAAVDETDGGDSERGDEKMGMKIANTKKFEQRYGELCDEMAAMLDEPKAGAIIENTRCRAAFGVLESIRAHQISGYSAERIIELLIEDAESRVMPSKKLEEMPEV